MEDLTKLRDHIQKSRNMVILLTPGIFERPWCLVEIVSVAWQVSVAAFPTTFCHGSRKSKASGFEAFKQNKNIALASTRVHERAAMSTSSW